MAVLANKIPGPAVFENLDILEFKMFKFYEHGDIDKTDAKKLHSFLIMIKID